ncbi:Lectin, galactoside-binding, soluble [Chamberlinius hualienensis]
MVPFLGMIPGGVVPGKKITIHGMVLSTCNRFSINLQCGPNVNPRDDIALHLNFRYDCQAPYVVRNHLQMQQWGLEEGHGYLSFARGHTFEILIVAEHDHYKIFFNGQHFSEFRYRIPIQRTTCITIDGEVAIHAVKIDGYDIHHASMSTAPYHMGPTMPYGPAVTSIAFVGPPRVGHTTGHGYPGYPMAGNVHPPSAAIPIGVGAVMGGAAVLAGGAHVNKKQKKAMKKAMKHHKHAKHSHHGMHGYSQHSHHGHHKSSSSSSSSSSEEEE